MKIPFFKKEEKANPVRVLFADESSRGALNKATLPNFMLNPPFGIPRFKDVITLRRLANTPQARMAKQTIIDEVVSVEWSINPTNEEEVISPALQNKIDEVTDFFNNPNTNCQSLEYLIRQMLNDLLDLDSGVWVKEFDSSQRMVELKVADASTFLKNPDIYGKYDTREDIIEIGTVKLDNESAKRLGMFNQAITYQTPVGISVTDAKNKAAYFQFGFTSNIRPIAFGKREIVWFEKNPQTNQIYGLSPLESLMEVLQNLLYSIEYNLDYFEDNNVPKGFINMPGADDEEMTAFRERWNESQLKTNSQGLLKKLFHRVPITNTENAQFIKVQFSSAEMQLLESQSWFSKLVWSVYGVTPSELGFTENSNLATEINQSRVFRRKAILPLLRLIEYNINNKIISEWDFSSEIEFKFNTFDTEDEKSKWELYQLQINTGAKTINEIRRREGLEEIEEPEIQSVKPEETNFDESNENPKDPDTQESIERTEKKAFDLNDYDIIIKELEKIIKKDKDLLLNEMRNLKQGRLAQIKDYDSVLRRLESLLDVKNLKLFIDQITKNIFNNGILETEKAIQSQGIVVNTVSSSIQKINFLSNMTFENVKGLSEDLKYKLRQSFKMGIANNEGLGSLTQRIESIFDVAHNRAEMIARTEYVRVSSAGQLHAGQQIQKDGVKLKKWLLWVNDKRTSDLTKALHKKYGSEKQAIPLNDNFVIDFRGKHYSQLAPPFHPNERDSLMTLIVDKE